jgi:hypothetical protein
MQLLVIQFIITMFHIVHVQGIDYKLSEDDTIMSKHVAVSSDSSSPLCLRILKEGSRVRQKHNCLGIAFIAALVTTCFGRAWPSSVYNVDVLHK